MPNYLDELEWLKKQKARNVILLGPAGLGKREKAMELAAAWLHTEVQELLYHPDFKLIEPEEGTLKAEKAEEIRNKAAYVTEEKAVCVVAEAQTMTPDLQNKLLKVLEDSAGELAVIFITTQELLETVSSRCLTVTFQCQTLEDFYRSIKSPIVPALLGAEGSPGTYQKIIQDSNFCNYLEGFYSAYCAIKTREQTKHLLRFTHALKEKDREYVAASMDAFQMDVFLCMLRQLLFYVWIKQHKARTYSWMHLGNLADIYTEEEIMYGYLSVENAIYLNRKKGKFTKNDFFQVLMDLILV
jgi:hypothetical protein